MVGKLSGGFILVFLLSLLFCTLGAYSNQDLEVSSERDAIGLTSSERAHNEDITVRKLLDLKIRALT